MICISILFGGIYNQFFGWAKFFDEFFWDVLDIARTSFEDIQNFKFQHFQNSLHPNEHYLKLLMMPLTVHQNIKLGSKYCVYIK